MDDNLARLQRIIHRMAVMLGVCCLLELFLFGVVGSAPNTHLPREWYTQILVAAGLGLLVLAWATRKRHRSASTDGPDKAGSDNAG